MARISASLSAAQIANTTADAYDVQYRYYSGSRFTRIATSPFATGCLPTSFSLSGGVPTTASDWRDITAQVQYGGALVSEWNGNQIVWNAQLSGQNYTACNLGPGVAIAALRKLTRVGYDSGWELEFLGNLIEGDHKDDYKRGLPWNRSLTGVNSLLDQVTAPRLTAGPVSAITGATVAVSSELATPSLEAGNGEFVGTTANVTKQHLIDSNMNTVWISQDAPVLYGETPAWAGMAVTFDEVFVSPPAGWDAAESWWVELVCQTDSDWYPLGKGASTIVYDGKGGSSVYNAPNTTVHWDLVNQDGQQLCITNSQSLKAGERAVLCGNRAVFEALTGGPHGAKIWDVKKWARITYWDGTQERTSACGFTLSSACGYLRLLCDRVANADAVAWNMTGGSPPGCDTWTLRCEVFPAAGHNALTWGQYTDTNPAHPNWTVINTAAVNLSTLNAGSAIVAGQSFRRKPSCTNTHVATNWGVENYPVPGTYSSPCLFQWATVTLPDIGTTASTNIAAGASRVYINPNCNGFLPSGCAILDSTGSFLYNSRSTIYLDNIPKTGPGSIAASHLAGVTVRPLVNAVEQTGVPVSQIVVSRNPALPAIKNARLYCSDTALGVPDPSTSASDWEPYYNWETSIDNAAQVSTLAFDLRDPVHLPPPPSPWFGIFSVNIGGLYRWVRKFAFCIDEMWDGGRAKINEIAAYLAMAALNNTATTDLNSIRSPDLAREMLLTAGSAINFTFEFQDGTDIYCGALGAHATAVEVYTRVLEDLARVTGCIVDYTLDGKVRWIADPWWPIQPATNAVPANPTWLLQMPTDMPIYTLSASNIRGEVQYQSPRVTVQAVTVEGTTGDGKSSFRVRFPAEEHPGEQVKDFTGYVVGSERQLLQVAELLYYHETHHDTVTITLKGAGEWCYPVQWLLLEWDFDGDGQKEITSWLVRRVSRRWNKKDGSAREWTTVLDLEEYYR